VTGITDYFRHHGTSNPVRVRPPRRPVGAGALHVRLTDPAQRLEAQRLLAQHLDVPVSLEPDPAALSVRVDDPELVAAGLAQLARASITVTNFAFGQPSLDEVFLALTGHDTESTGPGATGTGFTSTDITSTEAHS